MHGVREKLAGVFWSNEMKYITMGQVAAVIIGAIVFMLVNPFIGAVTMVGGLLFVQFCAHTYWTYRNMKYSDDFEYNPILGAVVGMILIYVSGIVIAAIIVGLLTAASMVTGYPLVLPGWIALGVGFMLYYVLK